MKGIQRLTGLSNSGAFVGAKLNGIVAGAPFSGIGDGMISVPIEGIGCPDITGPDITGPEMTGTDIIDPFDG